MGRGGGPLLGWRPPFLGPPPLVLGLTLDSNPLCRFLGLRLPTSPNPQSNFLHPHPLSLPSFPPQNFSHCISRQGNSRAKTLLAEKLDGIIHALYPSRPQLVIKYVVPAALSVANDTKGGAEAKAAATQLLGALVRAMGPALLDHLGSLTPMLQARVQDMVSERR